MTRKRRTVPADKARAALMGGEVGLRGFYSQIPEPAKIKCSRCDEERNSVGQEDGICLRCRWGERKAAREASA